MKLRIPMLAAALSVALTSAAVAAPLIPELRPRAGWGDDPDGFVVGLQALLRARLGGLVRLAPSLDVGFIDGGTATTVNLDLLTNPLTIPSTSIGFYAGLGGTFAAYNGDDFENNEFGYTVVVGADIAQRLYGEARFGGDEMPDVRLLAGLRLLMK